MNTEELLQKYMACESYSDIVLIVPQLADEIRRLKSENDLLACGMNKANQRNSEPIAMHCNNITATIEATEQPTLRDQFALVAFDRMFATIAEDYKSQESFGAGRPIEILGIKCYELADAMMEARK